MDNVYKKREYRGYSRGENGTRGSRIVEAATGEKWNTEIDTASTGVGIWVGSPCSYIYIRGEQGEGGGAGRGGKGWRTRGRRVRKMHTTSLDRDG